MRRVNFLVWVYPTEGESSNFLACRWNPSQFCPLVGHPDLPINPEEGAWSAYGNDFDKSE